MKTPFSVYVKAVDSFNHVEQKLFNAGYRWGDNSNIKMAVNELNLPCYINAHDDGLMIVANFAIYEIRYSFGDFVRIVEDKLTNTKPDYKQYKSDLEYIARSGIGLIIEQHSPDVGIIIDNRIYFVQGVDEAVKVAEHQNKIKEILDNARLDIAEDEYWKDK